MGKTRESNARNTPKTTSNKVVQGVKLVTGVSLKSNTSFQVFFTYKGRPCREFVKFSKITAAEAKWINSFKGKLDFALNAGTFDYAEFFPDSKNALNYSSNPGAHITIEEWFTAWCGHTDGGEFLADSTWATDSRIVRNNIIPDLGELMLDQVTANVGRDWVMAMNVSHKTRRNRLSVLSRGLDWAVEKNKLAVNPVASVKLKAPKEKKKAALVGEEHMERQVDAFNTEERKALYAALEPQGRNLIQFMIWTGLRPSEAVALHWTDIDWVNNRIRVNKARTQYTRGQGYEGTKTDNGDRFVDMLAPAEAALLAQKEHTFLAGGVVFTARDGKPLDRPEDITRVLEAACKRAGVRYRSAYNLRHTYASIMLLAQELPQWVSAQMGHASWHFTVDRYYEFIPTDIKNAGAKAVSEWGLEIEGKLPSPKKGVQ